MGVINLGILIRKLSHVFLRKDEAATELSTLGFVKNTDYATTTTGGVIKGANTYAFSISSSGYPSAITQAGTAYDSMNVNAFVSKGTIDNFKEKIVSKGVVGIAEEQITTPTAGTYTVKLTYDGTNWGVTIVKDT